MNKCFFGLIRCLYPSDEVWVVDGTGRLAPGGRAVAEFLITSLRTRGYQCSELTRAANVGAGHAGWGIEGWTFSFVFQKLPVECTIVRWIDEYCLIEICISRSIFARSLVTSGLRASLSELLSSITSGNAQLTEWDWLGSDSWHGAISEAAKKFEEESPVRLRGGASESDIVQAETKIGVRLPERYREFLTTSNGGRIRGYTFFSVGHIQNPNLQLAFANSSTASGMLAIGIDPMDRDFGFLIKDMRSSPLPVFAYEQEESKLEMISASFDEFLKKCEHQKSSA